MIKRTVMSRLIETSSPRFTRPGRLTLALLVAAGLLVATVGTTFAAAPVRTSTLWAQSDWTTASGNCGQPAVASGATSHGTLTIKKRGDRLDVAVHLVGAAHAPYQILVYSAPCGGYLGVISAVWADASGSLTASKTFTGARSLSSVYVLIDTSYDPVVFESETLAL